MKKQTTIGRFTFTKVRRNIGSSCTQVNVDKDGRPFGALWTFRNTKTEWHPWHAQALNGEHRTFPEYQQAVAYIMA